MINLNELNNVQLINHVEQSLVKYQEQKEMSANHTMQVYGGISGRELQIMEKALDRCMYLNPEAITTKNKVSEILQNDFSLGAIRPVGKIKSLFEIEQEKNKMAMNCHHDVKTIERPNLYHR